MTTPKTLALATLAAFALAGCSSGGDGGTGGTGTAPGSGSGSNPPAGGESTGSVGVLLTDAEGPQWDRALATISSIELLADDDDDGDDDEDGDGNVTIFSGEPQTIDLLSLNDYADLFTVADGIEPATFEKIRLRVDSLELVRLADDGSVDESVDARLVGNGKIDIEPRGDFEVRGGETLFVEVDFDMNKAFKTIETGAGPTIVRPVVFARVHGEGRFDRLTRIAGSVDSIDREAQRLTLCRSAGFADDDDDEGEDDDDDGRHCVRVATDDATGVFDADGLPVTFADVAVDDTLTAVGFLRHARGDDDDDDDGDDGADEEDGDDDADDAFGDDDAEHRFTLEAVTLELGESFERFRGTIVSDAAGNAFDFELGPGQGFEAGTVIGAELAASTRIFSRSGEELDTSAITADTRAKVDGIVALGGEGEADDRLRAALVVVATGAADAEQMLSGTVVAVDTDEQTLRLLVDGAERCVRAGGADIFTVATGDGLESSRVELAALDGDFTADVYGSDAVDGCFDATHILASGPDGELAVVD